MITWTQAEALKPGDKVYYNDTYGPHAARPGEWFHQTYTVKDVLTSRGPEAGHAVPLRRLLGPRAGAILIEVREKNVSHLPVRKGWGGYTLVPGNCLSLTPLGEPLTE